jgi:hypothetical protein
LCSVHICPEADKSPGGPRYWVMILSPSTNRPWRRAGLVVLLQRYHAVKPAHRGNGSA